MQFYGTNEGTSSIFFGDASSKKFGTYFVKDGKVGRMSLLLPEGKISRAS